MGQICGKIANIYRDITSGNRKNSSISIPLTFFCYDVLIIGLKN